MCGTNSSFIMQSEYFSQVLYLEARNWYLTKIIVFKVADNIIKNPENNRVKFISDVLEI